MTAAATAPDTFSEVFRLGVIVEDGSEIAFDAMLVHDGTSIDIADKDIESEPLANGGRAVHFIPQGDNTLTLKLRPVTVKQDGTGDAQFFYPQTTADSTQPILVDNTRTRKKHALIMTWAHPSLPATAGAAISADGATTSRRIQVINAYMVGMKHSIDNHTFGTEVKFKWAPFQKNGNSNERHESCDGSVILPAGTTSATAFA